MGVPVVAQWLTNLRTMRLRVRSLALLSGLTIRRCRELWCRLKMWLGSSVAVAVVQASSYSSDSTPSLWTSICCRSDPKKTKERKKENIHLLIGRHICNSMSVFVATPSASGGSQATGPVRAMAAGLCHSHTNAGSELRLWPTPQLTAMPDP